MSDCMETCEVGVMCPYGMHCDHIGAGRISVPEVLDILAQTMSSLDPNKTPIGEDLMMAYDCIVSLYLKTEGEEQQ